MILGYLYRLERAFYNIYNRSGKVPAHIHSQSESYNKGFP